ncbi:MAG: adenine deaminase [Thermoanaerobacteraceae bacterium]|nr:adenine deaminase [Thermoanaerobacteraceae bacterium]
MLKGLTSTKELMEVSRGERAADMIITGGRLINVYSGEIYQADVAVYQGRIAYVGTERKKQGAGTRIIKANGYFLCPGFIEPHGHPWSIFDPYSLAGLMLPHGTTAMMGENLLPYTAWGLDFFIDFMELANSLPFNFYWLVRAFPQSGECRDPELFSLEHLERLFSHPKVLSIGEMSRWFQVYTGQEEALKKIQLAKNCNIRIDGHTAGASYEKLNALVAGGITACHEPITAEQALHRLRLGLWTILRHNSLRPDILELAGLITEKKADTSRIMLTTDSTTPLYAARHGYTDGILRLLVQKGVDPVTAIQLATINPATYFGLDTEIGGIAPGRKADILLLPDLKNFQPDTVIVKGDVVVKNGKLTEDFPSFPWNTLPETTTGLSESIAGSPDTYRLHKTKPGPWPVINLKNAVITELTWEKIPDTDLDRWLVEKELLYISLLSKTGEWIVTGLLRNFSPQLKGLASTFNMSGDYLVVGSSRRAMALAAQRALQLQGGIVVADDRHVTAELPLPMAGKISREKPEAILRKLQQVADKITAAGYHFNDLLYTLLFFNTDHLPEVRITTDGILEVKTGTVHVRPVKLT